MTYWVISTVISSLLLSSGISLAAETVKLERFDDEVNYSLGYQIGNDLRKLDKKFNSEDFQMGLDDASGKVEPQLGSEEMSSLLRQLKQKIENQQLEKRKLAQLQTKEQYRGEGRDFLAQNAKQEGIVVLPSGLQYQVLREGAGEIPGPHDTVQVNYRGTLLDGSEFDSSYRRGQPAEFRVDGVISGWTEALQLMKEGARWKIYVPADLAYGERGPLADRTLIFDIELVSVLAGS
jgi:FKBP-type peptidyl-prolyl cis-trans isomerase FklB